MSENKTVKIIKCLSGDYWYSGYIGETFEVKDEGHQNYVVLKDFNLGPNASWRLIEKCDCEIVSPSPSIHPEDRERVYRWVKAEIRKPDQPSALRIEPIFFRKNGKYYLGHYSFGCFQDRGGSWWGLDGEGKIRTPEDLIGLEWLEEIAAPIPQPVGQNPEFLEWLDYEINFSLNNWTGRSKSHTHPRKVRATVLQSVKEKYLSFPQPVTPESLPAEVPEEILTVEKVIEWILDEGSLETQSWGLMETWIQKYAQQETAALRASLSSIKAERDEAQEDVEHNVKRALEIAADRDLYRKESEMYQSRYSELSEEIGKRNVEAAEYRTMLFAITNASFSQPEYLKKEVRELLNRYPKKEEEK